MAKRSVTQKKIRKVQRALQEASGGALEYIDLVQYVRDRRWAHTAGQARKLIQAGRVRYESHPLGKDAIMLMGHQDGPGMQPTPRLDGNPRVPASYRGKIRLVEADS